MCLFRYDNFKCGCQLYSLGCIEPCDAYRKTGYGLDVLTTVLIPHTDEHDDIDETINLMRFLTMPDDMNKMFQWHWCKEKTYAPVESKDDCPWHDEGGKKECVRQKRVESSEKTQREKVGVRHERDKPREKKPGLEKEHGCVVQ